LNYKDTFEALIINNIALSNVQRFHYLIASLKNEPKQLITNLAITNDNFTVAWNLIVERDNNVKLTAMKHVGLLMQMPQARKGDAASLRNLINHASSNFNAVEALHLTTSMHSLMLTHLLLSALDPDTRKAWELQTASQEDIPTTELLTFMEQRCKALELLPGQLTITSTPREKHTSASDNKVSRTTRTYMTSHIQCLLCTESHRLMHCDKFIKLSPQRRVELARQYKLCYNCLQVVSKGHVCSHIIAESTVDITTHFCM
jgi:diphosphomevalonate decarboxylase